MKNKITVALLSGGISSEKTVSARSGDQVFQYLDKEKYHVLRYDSGTDIQKLITDAPRIDIAMVMLHGAYGEDGTIQGLLDLLHIPYQCSGVLGSALAMNKIASKHLYQQAGIPVPAFLAIHIHDPVDLKECIRRLGMPLVVKPATGGSSIGTTIVESGNELSDAVAAAFEHDDDILLEAFIQGTEITGAVIGNKTVEALPLVEIIPAPDRRFFDYTAKYDNAATREICPAEIPEHVAETARELAVKAHRALFCQGYSRTDMIIKDGRVHVLETNTIPGMTPSSLLPQAAAAAGMTFPMLLDRLIELGLDRHRPVTEEPQRNIIRERKST
jgi:D-alanine-D-alanine ligase